MALVNTKAENREYRSGLKITPGTYVAVVMNNKDMRYAGRLDVWVTSFGGAPSDKMTWKTVSYANPFYGITPFASNKQVLNDQGGPTAGKAVSQQDSVAASQRKEKEEVKSYGMWVQPPEVGTRVLVTFTEGDDSRGFWFAAIPEIAHGMVPAIAKGESGKPEVEFDPSVIQTINEKDLHDVKREEYKDEVKKFETQGLQDDEFRGYVTSSSFRESPSKVMGFNTPSGHSLVMDDGDEDGKSKIIRIRTSAGNQITLNDDTGMIYLINSQGTGWMELSPTGYLDVYAEAGINMATKKDINLHADNDVNIHAGNNLKMVAMKGAKLQGTEELQLHSKKTMIEGVDGVHIHSCTEILVTSFKDIYMKAFQNFVLQGKCWRWNSGNAKEAEQVPPEKPTKVSDYDTTVKRAPQHEPYKEHDNGSSSQGGGSGGGAAAAGAASGAAAGAGIEGLLPSMSKNPANLMGTPTTSSNELGINGILPGMSKNPANLVGAPTSSAAKLMNGAVKTESVARASSKGASSTSSTPAISTAGAGADVAAQGAGITGLLPGMSQNPANLLGAGNGIDPASLASQALNSISGVAPASNIPAGAGGGQSGFATGDNCARPSGFGNGGGGNPDNLDTTLGQTPEDRQKIYDDLRAQGLTHEQAVGAMANINRESSFRPGAVGDNGQSYGLFQFYNDRRDGMTAAVPNWQTNPSGQIGYMFNNDASGVAYKNRSFSSSLDAANYFTNNVEIPANRASYTAPGGYNSRIVGDIEKSIIRRP